MNDTPLRCTPYCHSRQVSVVIVYRVVCWPPSEGATSLSSPEMRHAHARSSTPEVYTLDAGRGGGASSSVQQGGQERARVSDERSHL